MTVRTRRLSDERGSVSVWLALAAVALVLCVGIAVDLGGQVHAQQRARAIAAQAARTAGEEVAAAQAIRGHTPTVDVSAAKRAASAYLAQAGVTGTVTVRSGNVLDVTVTDTYTPMFLSSIGVGTLTVTGHSSARLVRAVQGTER
ncbi:TadE/TadG family type IV pilus assembly protein [Propionicicella superfundia]|uniref:TadE/TadG family type IV pilus assembly protein n=1 Tax=Propionicicella superfundia TaxID=348582 RepID=UPI0004908742|nr:TadE/TadG family type IV pilus assembly protein [Propionicicella superfundia]